MERVEEMEEFRPRRGEVGEERGEEEMERVERDEPRGSGRWKTMVRGLRDVGEILEDTCEGEGVDLSEREVEGDLVEVSSLRGDGEGGRKGGRR